MTVFAGALMIMVGIFQAIQGFVAIANQNIYVVGQEYVFQLSITTWGWIHLILGILVAVAGFFVFRAATWARVVGIVLAGLSAVLNFAWLPHYPLWSIVIIATDALIIWALTAHGRDIVR
jgi:hypothetical protein